MRAASSDPRTAVALARAVAHPWFRCQALAWVTRYAPDRDVLRLANEAMSACAADPDPDPFRKVAAAAWPLRALVERNHGGRALSALPRLLDAARAIDHPVRRLDALFLLWQAVFPLGPGARREVQDLMLAASRAADSWKAGYVMRDLVLMLLPEWQTDTDRLLDLVPPGKYRRQAARRVQSGESLQPRPFFWESE